jgi:hypothetical protein
VQQLGISRDAEIGVGAGVGESKAYFGGGVDFFVFGAPLVGDELYAATTGIAHPMHRA